MRQVKYEVVSRTRNHTWDNVWLGKQPGLAGHIIGRVQRTEDEVGEKVGKEVWVHVYDEMC